MYGRLGERIIEIMSTERSDPCFFSVLGKPVIHALITTVHWIEHLTSRVFTENIRDIVLDIDFE